MLNRGFAETMALKRSAGLETVACWQTDAQWTDREVREQLDALFAHRVYFATASARDARAAGGADDGRVLRHGAPRDPAACSALGRPDVRLHLPKHHAIASWSTPDGPPAAVHRADDPAARRSRAPRAARRPPGRARRTPPHRPAPAPLGSRAAPPSPPRRRRGGQLRAQPRRSRARERPHRASVGTATRSTISRRSSQQTAGGQLSRAGRARRRPQRALGRRAALAARARARTAGPRDAGAGRRAAARPDQPDPPPLQHRSAPPPRPSGGSSASPTRAWSSASSFTAATAAGRPDVLRDHRRRARAARAPASASRLRAGRQIRATRRSVQSRPLRPRASRADERRLRQARHDVHVAGWVLALEQLSADAPLRLRGPAASRVSPPLRSTRPGASRSARATCACPAAARRTTSCAPTPTARASRSSASRPSVPTRSSRCPAGRPGVWVQVRAPGQVLGRDGAARRDEVADRVPAIDVMVELDDRLPRGRAAAKLERYDHFLGRLVACTRSLRPRARRGRWSCSSAATARGRASAPGAPTRAERLPRLRRRVSVRLGVPRARADRVRRRARHPRGAAARLRSSSSAARRPRVGRTGGSLRPRARPRAAGDCCPAPLRAR